MVGLMKKTKTIVRLFQQLCFAHGLQRIIKIITLLDSGAYSEFWIGSPEQAKRVNKGDWGDSPQRLFSKLL